MKKSIKIYLKCVYYNKVLMIGYILLLANFIPLLSIADHFLLTNFGIILISLCKAGQHTISTYKRCLSIHQLGHNVKIDTFWYCDRAGYNWYKNEIKLKT